jgi:exopolyphosphatase/guanosine-5'-triphosphate,3'-diphosphate pyrophosphatase
VSAPTVAAIDIGTTSTNLLVVDGTGRRAFRTVDTRLGRGLAPSGVLDAGAIERTVDTVASHLAAARDLGAHAVCLVGTQACRIAANTGDLAAALAARTGLELRVLTGEEEGRYARQGVARAHAHLPHPLLVVDIGGGSTELATRPSPDVPAGGDGAGGVVSLPFGAASLTSAELHADPPRPEELANALGVVHDHLDDAVRQLPAILDAATVVGVGGTMAVIAAVDIGLPTWGADDIHGHVLGRHALEEVFRTLATEPIRDRRYNPGLPETRVDVIVGGLCIAVAIARRLAAGEVVVSAVTLLDAVAHELWEASR